MKINIGNIKTNRPDHNSYSVNLFETIVIVFTNVKRF